MPSIWPWSLPELCKSQIELHDLINYGSPSWGFQITFQIPDILFKLLKELTKECVLLFSISSNISLKFQYFL